MPTLDATVYPNEAYVLVQVSWPSIVITDYFTRTVASGWGVSSSGHTWTVSSGANTSVNGFAGIHSVPSAGATVTSEVSGSLADVEGVVDIRNFVLPTGDISSMGMRLRYVDANNFVDTRVFFGTANDVYLTVRQMVGGVETFSGFNLIGGVIPTTPLTVRLNAVGPLLQAKLWATGTPEPGAWQVTMATTHLSAGGVLLATNIGGATTNPTPVIFWWDNLNVVSMVDGEPDCVLVTRRNTVTGEVVNLRPYIFFNEDGALMLECGQGLWWDTEPPLNVPLEYCATACDTQVALSANCCFEAGMTAPWTATGGVLTSSSTFFHEGASSGLLTPTGGVVEPRFSQNFTGVLAGVPLTFSAWVMSPQGWNGVFLRMSLLYSDGKTEITETPVEILDDNEWRFLSATVTPRLDATATFSFITTGAPPNTTLFYVDQIQATIAQAVTTTVCETVTVNSESFWLKNPLHPCLDVEVGTCTPMLQDCEEESRVSYVGMSEESYGPNTILMQPVNRRRPVPVNRIRRDVEATLRVVAHDCDARDAVLAANQPGDPLLWQAPAEYCIPDRYMSVGVVTDSKISVDQREPFRLIAMPHVAVDRPEGPADGVCGARIMDLCDIYTSWAALGIAGLTWTDLLLGEASPNGPGQPDPPAAARTWDDVEAEFADWDAVEAGGTRDWDELRDGL